MPELPEVETVLMGLRPQLTGARLAGAEVREPRLRWPVPADLDERLRGQRIRELRRRGKYLLVELEARTLILHLGMSGSLRLVGAGSTPGPHDHLDLLLADGRRLRLTDPRRFGSVLLADEPEHHPLIARLGIEPLSAAFDGAYLYRLCRGRRTAIKHLLMDARLIAGVGNIYANEALFRAGIDPRTPAGRLGQARCARLVAALHETLREAIAAGGSTLRDFVDGHGRAGYFQLKCAVYGRAGQPCPRCGGRIVRLVQGGRSSYLCPRCQRS
ncbi:MAG: bifunctional DNA-formamidopyrimidine glycosylase/DNA-(apurinic or apyrimidinic site) lyase [Thiobacillaceae bacterium]|nr:bifunctional DNA-formamidopyrimidine glycosylase/DNA-(apurinic or apyrimidinic site) lyase [Thiobacillaceae bacterium]MDW8324525.1 bifunctional DNA-formamidopyrimidine glycosylase/DNA-(apurinic or apyrimidinic site) lyase [Burkholderiales bacterium]